MGRSGFRRRILALVVAVGVAPLALLAFWLTGSGTRAAEALLRAQLHEALERAAYEIGGRWVRVRSDALDRRLVDAPLPGRHGAIATRLPAGAAGNSDPDWIEVRTSMDALLPPEQRRHGLGISLGAVGEDGVLLVALPVPVERVETERSEWGGETWLIERRALREPPLELVAAAPLDPLLQPFLSAARQGLLWVAAVSALGALAAVLLTRRMSASLEGLGAAARAVRRGELDHRVRPTGSDELAELGRAFDAMAQELQKTLRTLSHRESLAAVGRFAAELAHEMRNPLTAIRVDLQYVQEHLPADSDAGAAQQAALAAVLRLERTLTGALQVARSGSVELRNLDLREVLLAATASARAEFQARGAELRVERLDGPLPVRGDADALQRLFLNLFHNAAQALDAGGSARLHAERAAGELIVTLDDDGPGIPEDILERVREPFFTTRSQGTGLGLALAERIAQAHHGRVDLETREEGGTRVRVTLPTTMEAPADT